MVDLSTLLAASTDYARNGRRLRLGGTASTALKIYQQLGQVEAVSHSAGVGATIGLPKQGSLRVDQSAASSPSYLLQLFPGSEPPALGSLIPANPDYQIQATDSYSSDTTMACRVWLLARHPGDDLRRIQPHRLSGTSHNATRSRGLRDCREDFAAGDAKRQSFNRVSIQHWRVRARWYYERTSGHDRNRVLAGTVAYTAGNFRFDLSPGRLEIPESAVTAIAAGETNGRVNRMSAEASVTLPLRPNWRTSASYRRSVEYLAILGEPVFADSAQTEVTGLIARRVDLSLSAGYATAASVLSGDRQPLETLTGEVRIRYAVNHAFALYFRVYLLLYDQHGQTGLAPGLPSVFEQHTGAHRGGVVLRGAGQIG